MRNIKRIGCISNCALTKDAPLKSARADAVDLTEDAPPQAAQKIGIVNHSGADRAA